MDWRERISLDPAILGGKPAIRGTRLGVEYILELLAAGKSIADILAGWPGLDEADVRACIAYALDAVRVERVIGYRHPA
jgi:uncharacterized protein (DUF433 family)